MTAKKTVVSAWVLTDAQDSGEKREEHAKKKKLLKVLESFKYC